MRTIKLCAVALCGLALLFALALLPAKLCFNNAKNYSFFCGNGSINCREVRAGKCAGLKKLTLKDVCGECAEYDAFDLDSFLEEIGGEIEFTEDVAGTRNYYISGNLPYTVVIDGVEICAHVCYRADGVKVGSPIIFGGY